MKLDMNFSVAGGVGTLSYRDLTTSGAWTTDGTIVNVPLGLTANGSGQYGMLGGLGMRINATGGMIDNISLSSPTILVPEPSTLALLAAGMIGCLACAWRKRR